MLTINQKTSKLIKNLLLIAAFLPAIVFAKGTYEIKNPRGDVLTLRLAITPEEHSRGLSGIKSKNFTYKEGMLFVNEMMGTRRFWMPNTYFNLDIIFLDSNLVIVGSELNAPMHPGAIEPPVIFRTKAYQAQFVLETKAGAPFAKDLKTGDKLIWNGTNSLSEIILRTHQRR